MASCTYEGNWAATVCPQRLQDGVGRRAVVLMPQLASVLITHRLASLHSLEADYVFPAPDGRGRDHRSTAKGDPAGGPAGWSCGSGISAHSFRHTFASQLIIGLLHPARVSRSLGHTSPAFTASTYAHMFEQARHADELRELMADGDGHLLVDLEQGMNYASLRAMKCGLASEPLYLFRPLARSRWAYEASRSCARDRIAEKPIYARVMDGHEQAVTVGVAKEPLSDRPPEREMAQWRRSASSRQER